jgi:hypothetical protein
VDASQLATHSGSGKERLTEAIQILRAARAKKKKGSPRRHEEREGHEEENPCHGTFRLSVHFSARNARKNYGLLRATRSDPVFLRVPSWLRAFVVSLSSLLRCPHEFGLGEFKGSEEKLSRRKRKKTAKAPRGRSRRDISFPVADKMSRRASRKGFAVSACASSPPPGKHLGALASWRFKSSVPPAGSSW